MRPDFIIFAVALMAPLVEGTDDSKPFEPQSLPETVDIDTHDLWKRKGGSGNGGRGRGSRFAGGAPHYKHGSQNSFRSAIRKISYSIATRKKVDHLGGDTRAYPRSQPDRGGRALGSSPGSMLRYGALTPPKQYPGGSSDRSLPSLLEYGGDASSFNTGNKHRQYASPDYPEIPPYVAGNSLGYGFLPFLDLYGDGYRSAYASSYSGGRYYGGSSKSLPTSKLMTAAAFCSYGIPMAAAAFGALDALRVSTGLASLGTSAAVIPLRTAERVPQIAWISNYVAWAVCFITYLTLQTALIPYEAVYQRRLYIFTVILAAVHFTISMSQGFDGVGDGFALYGPLVSTACAYVVSLLFSLNRATPRDSAPIQMDQVRQTVTGMFCV